MKFREKDYSPLKLNSSRSPSIRQKKPSIKPNYRTKAGGAVKVKTPNGMRTSPMQINIPSTTNRNPSISKISHSRSLYIFFL